MQKTKLNSCVVRFVDEANTVQLHDFAADMPTERKFKDSGAMIAPCSIARTGIMQYHAKDCGDLFADRDPMSIVKIATLEVDLFDEDSIESYRSAPITIGHPEEDVDIHNAKELQVGHLEALPEADGSMLTGNIVLNDAAAIQLVEAGVEQLSSGTTCTLVLADEGEEYDAKKINIRANHVAIVKAGRNGNAKIADSALEEEVETDPTKVQEEAEAKAKAHLEETEAKLADALTLIGTLEAKLEATEEKVTLADTALQEQVALHDAAAIDKLVAERLVFVSSVARLSDMDITGMSETDAKRAVVAQLLDKDLSDKSESYIEARFEIALEDSDNESPMATLLAEQVQVELNDQAVYVSPAEVSRQNMIARTQGNK